MSEDRYTFRDRLVCLWMLLSYIFSWRSIALWVSPWVHMVGCPDKVCRMSHVHYSLVVKHRMRELLTQQQYDTLDKVRRKMRAGTFAMAFGDEDVFLEQLDDMCAPTDERKRRELRAKLGQDDELVGVIGAPLKCTFCDATGVRLDNVWVCVDAAECAMRTAERV